MNIPKSRVFVVRDADSVDLADQLFAACMFLPALHGTDERLAWSC